MNVWRIALSILLTLNASGQVTGRFETRFRADSSLVMVNATVFDRSGAPVTTLAADNFRVVDQGKNVSVEQFAIEQTPVSAVILFDVSKSMRKSFELIRAGLEHFLANAGPHDEFCLILFAGSVEEPCEFTTDARAVLAATKRTVPEGRTALLDNVVMAMQKAVSGANPHRAVLIFSDGRDTASIFGWKEAWRHAMESQAVVYGIAPVPWGAAEMLQRKDFQELVEISGGRLAEVRHDKDYPQIIGAFDIRWQYMLGYRLPPETRRDGKWRKVKVLLRGDEVAKNARVYWRRGYYAPNQ